MLTVIYNNIINFLFRKWGGHSALNIVICWLVNGFYIQLVGSLLLPKSVFVLKFYDYLVYLPVGAVLPLDKYV